MNVVTIVGARPQFIKTARASLTLHEAGHTEFLIHTGQHYDYGMSQVFFDEIGIPEPDVNFGIGSGSLCLINPCQEREGGFPYELNLHAQVSSRPIRDRVLH